MADGPTFTAPDFGGSPIEYFKQVKIELKRVEWPSRDHVLKATALVLIVSIIVGAFLGGLDYLFTTLFGYAIS